MVAQIYAMTPLRQHNGIPVFSAHDEYTDNYEQISRDHLAVFRREGRNPFMKEDHWVECEDSTAELLRQYSMDGDMVLDVGVGMGRLLCRFPNLRRFGMDISFRYLEYAQSSGIEVCYSRIEDMPYSSGVFDVVVCTDVLEHVLDLNAAFSKIVSVLKPGGTLIVRVPYREDLRPYTTPQVPYRYVHLRNFDEYGIRLFVERIFGLALVRLNYAGYINGGGRLKYGQSIPQMPELLRRILRITRCIHRGFHEALALSLYYPAVINFVVRKTFTAESHESRHSNAAQD